MHKNHLDDYIFLYLEEPIFWNCTKLKVFHQLSEKPLSDDDQISLKKLWNALQLTISEIKNISLPELHVCLKSNEPVLIFSTDWPLLTFNPTSDKYDINQTYFWSDHFNTINNNLSLKKKFWKNFNIWFNSNIIV